MQLACVERRLTARRFLLFGSWSGERLRQRNFAATHRRFEQLAYKRSNRERGDKASRLP
jgi:hypothetical protein